MTNKKPVAPQFYQVRVYRSTDDEYADVGVSASSPRDAVKKAEKLVRKDPTDYFGPESTTTYYAKPEYDGVDNQSSEEHWDYDWNIKKWYKA